nr:Chain z, UPF0642 protein YBL028C [Saccharomyces cerevisiae BY4741]
AKSLRA